jgi:hypothetical protein
MWKTTRKDIWKYIAVDVKAKKILSMMKVTTDDEHVHNGKALPELVDEA